MSVEKPRRQLSRREILYLLGGGGLVVLGAALGLNELAKRDDEAADTDASSPETFADQPTLDLDFRHLPDGSPIDTSVFGYEDGNTVADYNEEAQTYTGRPENIRIEGGALVIQGHKERLNDREYTSGRLFTKGRYDFLYGKIEVEAKMPKGTGTVPAIWLRTSDTPYTDGATAEERAAAHFHIKNGEIDIVEGMGAYQGKALSTVHTHASKVAGDNPHGVQIDVPDMYDQFHTYGVEWAPNSVTFLLDGQPYHQVLKTSDDTDIWPFNHHFHLVLNLALGGEWARGVADRMNLPFENGIDDSMEEFWKMYIRAIRYYPLNPTA